MGVGCDICRVRVVNEWTLKCHMHVGAMRKQGLNDLTRSFPLSISTPFLRLRRSRVLRNAPRFPWAGLQSGNGKRRWPFQHRTVGDQHRKYHQEFLRRRGKTVVCGRPGLQAGVSKRGTTETRLVMPLTLAGTVISFFHQVDSTNGMGYWVSHTNPITIAKTSGNAGSTPMVGAPPVRVGGGK